MSSTNSWKIMGTCLIEQFQEPLQFAVFSAYTHPRPLNLADKSSLFIAVPTVPTTAAAAALK